MRRGFFLRARPDFVAALLTQGRLVDVLLFQHFGAEPAITDTNDNNGIGPAATKKDGNTDGVKVNASDVEKSSGKAAELTTAKSPVTAPSQRSLLRERCDAVRTATKRSAHPVVWPVDAGTAATEWRAPPNSQDHVRVALGSDGSNELGRKVVLHGSFIAIAAPGSIPKTMQLLASQECGKEDQVKGTASNREPLLLSLPMQQAGGHISVSPATGGLCTVTLSGAEAAIVSNSAAAVDAFTAEHNLLAAAASSGMIDRLLEICALHATHAVRHDALLIRNPFVQKALAAMACSRYGIDALTSFVVGCSADDPSQLAKDTNPVDSKENEVGDARHPPLAECVAVSTYAGQALATALQLTREVINGVLQLDPQGSVPHASKPDRLIDYAYAVRMLRDESQILAALSFRGSLQHQRYIAPLLLHTESGLQGAAGSVSKGIGSSLFMRAISAPSDVPRLVSPHVYLRLSANELEGDVATFLKLLREGERRRDAAFIRTTAQYVAEVFASVAVLYRATAALTRTGNNAPRDWLLAQAFCGESAVCRAALLRNFEMSKAARTALLSAGNNSGTIHPVELMNAQPVRKMAKTPTH